MFVCSSHVMNELLDTERAYVEELLCVLEVSIVLHPGFRPRSVTRGSFVFDVPSMCPQGYAAELDNPVMAHLVPSTLLSKKDVLFGNMPEIYQFHKRWTSF